MSLNFEARKKFYEKELEAGEIILHNGAFYTSAMAGPETLNKLKNAEFPENAVTVLGKQDFLSAKKKIIFLFS